MRDPNRIEKYCAILAKIWHKFPDFRFGQLMSVLLGEYVSKTGMDIFFPEDEEFFRDLEEVAKSLASPYYPAEGGN